MKSLARLLAWMVTFSLVATALTGNAPSYAQESSPFTFQSLLLPFPAGEGMIINGYDNDNQHTRTESGKGTGNLYSLDFCRGAGCTRSTIGDSVLAPTDLELIHTDTSRNGIENDPLDYHFFQIAANADQRLCMAIGHFDLTAVPVEQNGKLIYPRGSQLGTVLDYNDGDGSIPHIHLGLWTVPSGIGCAGDAEQRHGLAFTDAYALDGVSYPIGSAHEGAVVSHNDPAAGPDPAPDQALGITGQPVETGRWETSGTYVFTPKVTGGSVYTSVLNDRGATAAILDGTSCAPVEDFAFGQDSAAVVAGPNGTHFLVEGTYGAAGAATVATIDAASGDELWRTEIGAGVAGEPLIEAGAIILSGGIYQGENESDGFIVALDAATGTELWRTTPGFAYLYEPVLHEGLIYAGTFRQDGGAALLAFDPATGAEQLRRDIPEMWSISTPAFSPGIAITTAFSYDVDEGGAIAAFDTSTGDILWTTVTDIDVVYTPEILDGVAYAGSFNSEGDAALFAFDVATGNELWRFTPGASDGNGRDYAGSPAIVDGLLYTGAGTWDENGEGELYALELDGNVIWQFEPEPALDLLYPPVVVNGRAYAGSSDDGGAALVCLTGNEV